MKTNGATERVDLAVKPLPQGRRGRARSSCSYSRNIRSRKRRIKRRQGAAGKGGPGRVAELEKELAYTRESLQATVEEAQATNEELTSANEEMQSTNEEMQSTNEELETSKEELQSVNEELTTVNSELQSKIDQLSRSRERHEEPPRLHGDRDDLSRRRPPHKTLHRIGYECHQPHPHAMSGGPSAT